MLRRGRATPYLPLRSYERAIPPVPQYRTARDRKLERRAAERGARDPRDVAEPR
jgi:hypothetical protein